MLALTETKSGLAVEVDVKVRASQTRIVGVVEGRLQVAIAAPPVDGAANEALIKLVAKRLNVRRAQVILVAGERHRRKRLAIVDLSEERIQGTLS